jgi:ParB/RepB/Spo0J family partition protein
MPKKITCDGTFHPVANIFPLLEGKAFTELVESIKNNGLRRPIIVYQAKILDGRNRYRACQAAGVRPVFDLFIGGDALAFVLDENLHRRHLDESQRAMVAARLANMRQGTRTDIASIEAMSQPQAAKRLNVGRACVQRARAVVEHGTQELQAAVEQGKIAVSVAEKIAELNPEEQARVIAEPKRASTEIKKLHRAKRERELAEKQCALPQKKFGVILADPEWRFEPYTAKPAWIAQRTIIIRHRQPT